MLCLHHGEGSTQLKVTAEVKHAAFKAAVSTKLPLQDSQLSYTTGVGFRFSRAGSRLETLKAMV